MSSTQASIHATTVSMAQNAVLILGPSGAGKSAIALDLMARGATLIADDQTIVRREEDMLFARAPATISGMIEARGLGVFDVNPAALVRDEVQLSFAVDLGRPSTARLPEPAYRSVLGVTLPCFGGVKAPHLVPTILLCLAGTITLRP
ncbi:MAG: HPr kinase/phosphatase C-terminal domain-containing protein [Pseudomonadota bacterium]